QLEVSGDDFDTLQTLGNDLADKLQKIEGISFTKSEANELDEEMAIVLNRKQLEKDDLSTEAIYQQMHGLFAKVPIGEVLKNQKTTPIFLENDVTIGESDDLLAHEIMTPHAKEELSKYIALEKVSAPTRSEERRV